MLTKNDFTLVATIQQRFYDAGWRWQENTFNDEHGQDEVHITFSLSKNPFAFRIGDNSTNDERRYGWGRFERTTAWMKAEAFLLDEQTDDFNRKTLKEYKAKYAA